MPATKAQLCYDTLLIQTLVSDEGLTKSAQSGIVGSIIDKVKNYVSSHIDPNDKLGSVINILIPGALAMLGFPIIGAIVEIATSWFGLNLGKILEDIASEIKNLITGGNKTSSSAVESVVHRVFNNNAGGDPTQNDLDTAQHSQLKLSMRQMQLYKITMHQYMQSDLKKRAQILSTLGRFVGLKGTTVSALVKIVGWVIKVILASAGFMVADDAIHGLVGSKSHTDFSGPQADTTTNTHSTIAISAPTQTTFKVNPSYNEDHLNLSDRWIEPVAPSQLGNEIVQWTHDIYPDTKSLSDEDIRSTAGFSKAMQLINDYNATNKLNVTFMPKLFTSRKKVVDLLIDELANKASVAKPLPTSPAPTAKGPKISDLM